MIDGEFYELNKQLYHGMNMQFCFQCNHETIHSTYDILFQHVRPDPEILREPRGFMRIIQIVSMHTDFIRYASCLLHTYEETQKYSVAKSLDLKFVWRYSVN